MLGELVPCGGGGPIPLLRSHLLVGRRERCDICLNFPNVSSEHCELELVEGYWQVRDLNSTNGVKVNGIKVEVQVLMPGDGLAIAKHAFEVVYQPQSDGPPPEIETEDAFSRPLLEKAGLERRRMDRRVASRRKANPEPDPEEADQGDTQVLDWLTEEDSV